MAEDLKPADEERPATMRDIWKAALDNDFIAEEHKEWVRNVIDRPPEISDASAR